MKIWSYLSVLVSVFVCTACADPTFAWQVNKEFREQGIMVIHPYSGEHTLNRNSGFEVTMRPEDAKGIQAPKGPKFLKLLDERVLQEERKLGRKLCQSGYEIIEGHTINYHGMYIQFDVACKAP